jgi:hypothetical protein
MLRRRGLSEEVWFIHADRIRNEGSCWS